MRVALFLVGMVLLITLEVMRVYFIMPIRSRSIGLGYFLHNNILPGTQRSESIGLAYFLHNNILYFRLIGWLMILYPVIYFFNFGAVKGKVFISLALIAYAVVFYLFNFRYRADKWFYQPKHKTFSSVSDNKVSGENLVLGVQINNASKAYPIQFIGYHHQVRDSIGGVPVMITYCAVCRTGRVFSPYVDSKLENFRLVGMDHFNAMFEDETTGSWWRQVNGEAIAGPHKGHMLAEIASEQMTLKSWILEHPATKIMQPDSTFNEKYEAMKEYDTGGGGILTGRDSLSWKDKSWVVGVQIGTASRAYDWNDLVNQRVINDTLSKTPIAVVLEDDSASFHVYRRDLLEFRYDADRKVLVDLATQSTWDWNGVCREGTLQGQRLSVVQSYQEFWHSWSTFKPNTTVYKSAHD